MSKPIIAVVFYSTYGHISLLAEEVIKGAEAAGAEVRPFQIQETLSEEILGKMYAGSSLKPKYPIITPNDLKEVDGVILGAPTRFGRLPAQVSAFFDATGGLWASGGLVGKFASTFTSTASQHGGHETTHLTTIPFFAHHGMIYVPIGFTQPYLTDLADAHGGSAYGVSSNTAGDGSKMPTEGELALAKHQGEYFAGVVGTFVRGKHLAAAAVVPTPADEVITTTGTSAKALPDSAQDGYKVEPTAAAPASTPAAAAPAPAAAARAPAQKKSGGFFSCCSGSGIDQ